MPPAVQAVGRGPRVGSGPGGREPGGSSGAGDRGSGEGPWSGPERGGGGGAPPAGSCLGSLRPVGYAHSERLVDDEVGTPHAVADGPEGCIAPAQRTGPRRDMTPPATSP